jgi:hypothetical protein
MPPATGGSNGLAVAALVLGILTFFCLGPLGAILAIVLGFLGLKKAREVGVGKGMSIAGMVLGAVGLVGSLILIVALVSFGKAAKDATVNISGAADPSTYQLTPGDCAVDDFGFATYQGTIKNTTSSKKNFTVNVEFRNKASNAVADTSLDIVSDIQPGDTAEWKVTTSVDQGAQVTCKVTQVENFFN